MSRDRRKGEARVAAYRVLRPVTPESPKDKRVARYVRFSHRYNAFQVQTREGVWVNVRPVVARAYVAAGFGIGTQGV